MSSINSREVVDKIIAGNGRYPGDNILITEIIEYSNIFDGRTTYKLVTSKDDRNYIWNALACRDKKVLWKREAK